MRALRLASIVTAALLTLPAAAQELQQKHLKVIGGWSNVTPTNVVEKPFWTEKLPAASNKRISADFSSLDVIGLKGTETLRLLKLQVADVISGPVSFVGGDFKLYDGLDLAGLILDLDTMRKAVEAYRPIMNKNMEENFGAKLIAVWPSPPQVLFCRDKISGIQDLKGKKIRSFNQTLADFVEGVGATAVSLSFAEVVPALQHGTVDCGITGSGPGNSAKWWEVTSYLYPLVLGWAPYFSAINVATWNRMDKKTQDFLAAQVQKMETDMWAHIAEVSQEGVNCNTGKGECRTGIKANMNLVDVSNADREQLKKLLADSVLPKFAQRCGDACTKDWNASVGKVLGVTAQAK